MQLAKLPIGAERWHCAHDFAREITGEWKDWLTGSLPMAILAVLSLVNPDWVRLPVWSWAILIFVAGLLTAMFRIYRDLRRERDELRDRIAGVAIAGPFILVPFEASVAASFQRNLRRENPNDL